MNELDICEDCHTLIRPDQARERGLVTFRHADIDDCMTAMIAKNEPPEPTVWDRLAGEPDALETIFDALSQAEFWTVDDSADDVRNRKAFRLWEIIQDSTISQSRATPARRSNEMAMQKVAAPNGAKLYTYDTPEEIDGYTPVKVDNGQIVQIPAGATTTPPSGGRWMVVSPFNEEPWGEVVAAQPLPEGFEAIFGPAPIPGGFHGPSYPTNYQQARDLWQQNLDTFTAAGMPPGSDDAKVAAARNEAIFYGMGEPHYYANTHGYQVRFPESQAEDFQADADTFINTGTGQIIVVYQDKLSDRGIIIPVEQMHPLAPPTLTKKQVKLRNAAVS
jgi:hypothetical protein